MDLGLEGKVVFVTGASGGIGRAVAEAFGEVGSRLVLHANARAAELERWLGDQAFAERALVVTADVTEPAAVELAFDAALERFGRVDVCVANAGFWPRPAELLHEASIERLRHTLDVDLGGAIWTARAFFKALARTGPRPAGEGAAEGASLVFTGSTAGRFGERHHADYAAAKAGLFGLVQSLKNEIVALDPWGRVNLVEPGWTVTHMVRPELDQPGALERTLRTMPLRQLGRAADVARAILFLSSPILARHVSGQTLTVAGGMEGRVLWETDDVDAASVRERLAPDRGRNA